MRIGIDIRGTQFASGLRGIGRYIFNLITGVSRMAPENDYVLIAFPDLPLPEPLRHLPPNCRVVPFRAAPLSRDNWYHRVPRCWHLYAALASRAHADALRRVVRQERLDVLHLTDVFNQGFYSDVRPPCRCVATLYDLIPLVMADDFIRLWDTPAVHHYRMGLQALRSADAVVAISDSARGDAVRLAGLEAGRVETVLCAVADGFDPATGVEGRHHCRDKYGIRHPYFLFCSGSGPNKNRARVVQAFGRFIEKQAGVPWHLVFVGPKDEERFSDIPALKAIAFDSGMTTHQFLVTGFVSEEDIVSLFAGAAALLTPSLYEGFGLPAAQAMRIGTPIIASDRSSYPEVIGDAGLMVDPYDIEAISDAMVRLVREPDLRSELIQRGRERSKLFDWERQAQKMLNVYGGAGV